MPGKLSRLRVSLRGCNYRVSTLGYGPSELSSNMVDLWGCRFSVLYHPPHGVYDMSVIAECRVIRRLFTASALLEQLLFTNVDIFFRPCWMIDMKNGKINIRIKYKLFFRNQAIVGSNFKMLQTYRVRVWYISGFIFKIIRF